MSPINPSSDIDTALTNVISDLYDLQSLTSSYLGPQTRDVLIRKIHDLTSSLQTLSASTSRPDAQILIPPEIIDYVDSGRNPDIYTREFVESVQKLNMVLRGKSEAFGGFAGELGRELVEGGFATTEEVGQIRSLSVEEGLALAEAEKAQVES